MTKKNPWPLFGYAPGHYSGLCRICNEEQHNIDKRASMCLECAVSIAREELEQAQQQLTAAQCANKLKTENTSIPDEVRTTLAVLREQIDVANDMAQGVYVFDASDPDHVRVAFRPGGGNSDQRDETVARLDDSFITPDAMAMASVIADALNLAIKFGGKL